MQMAPPTAVDNAELLKLVDITGDKRLGMVRIVSEASHSLY
jgi:hypothetical protein